MLRGAVFVKVDLERRLKWSGLFKSKRNGVFVKVVVERGRSEAVFFKVEVEPYFKDKVERSKRNGKL